MGVDKGNAQGATTSATEGTFAREGITREGITREGIAIPTEGAFTREGIAISTEGAFTREGNRERRANKRPFQGVQIIPR